VTKSQGAGIKRFRSNQDLGTPTEFLAAVRRRFGRLDFDLAANFDNTVGCLPFFGPGSPAGDNALSHDWTRLLGNLWCNCPFELIPEFAGKMARECRDRPDWALLLTPASSGSNWAKVCEENGYVLVLEDRMRFVGQSDIYPKDLMLTAFGFGIVGRARWHWDTRVVKAYERAPRANVPRKTKAAITET
jgi:hypothetical protein